MAAVITSTFDIYTPYPISYGLEVDIKETSELKYRNKVGINIYVSYVFIGKVEIDIFEKDKIYTLEIGEVVKEYIQKGPPKEYVSSRAGMVNDNMAGVRLVPYSKNREYSDTTWTIVNGSTKELYAIRGINKALYLDGDFTPQQPGGSNVFDNVPGVYSIDVPYGSYKFLYKELWHDSQYYAAVQGNWYIYDDEGHGLGGGVLNTGALSIEEITAYFNVNSYLNSTYNKVDKLVLEFNINAINRISGVSEMILETWYITVNFTCNKEYDFSTSMIHLDNTFNWNSVPFNMKNETALNRTNNTVEGYDYKKTDYNTRVRRTYELKSDYLEKDEANEVLLLGTTTEVYVMAESSYNLSEARLLNQAIPLRSAKNEGLVQVEVQLELSNLIPVA